VRFGESEKQKQSKTEPGSDGSKMDDGRCPIAKNIAKVDKRTMQVLVTK
jgi:hypothetical protein